MNSSTQFVSKISKGCTLIFVAQRFPCSFIVLLTLLKPTVVYKSSYTKNLSERYPLDFGGVETVFESSFHCYILNCIYYTVSLKAPKVKNEKFKGWQLSPFFRKNFSAKSW